MNAIISPVLPARVTMHDPTKKKIFCTSQRLSLLMERTEVRQYLSGESFFLDRHPELRGEEKPKAVWRGLKRDALVRSLTAEGTVKRLAVVCSAGLGKSTNLEWLAYKLAHQSKQVPFYFELDDEHLPGRLVEFFDITLPDCMRLAEGNADLPDKHLRAALLRVRAQGRITLFMDSIDQATSNGLKLLKQLLDSPAWKGCPIVMSARPHAIFDRWEELIGADPGSWRFVRVEPLAPRQRRLLLDDDSTKRYRQLPSRGRSLMENPRNIEYVREMDKNRGDRPTRQASRQEPSHLLDYTLRHLRTASHVFAGAADNMIRIGMKNNENARKLMYSKDDSPPDEPDDEQVEFALDLLGALAYTMYCRPAPEGADDKGAFRPNLTHVPARDMTSFRKDVLQKLRKAGVVEDDYRRRDLKFDLDALAELNHAIQYDLLDNRTFRRNDFRWYNRSLQEFFAAVWLSRYADKNDLKHLRRQWRYDDTREKTKKSLYEPLWGFLVEMPRAVRKDEVWAKAIGVLFEHRVPRCCEMIYRSWPTLRQSKEGRAVIRHWRTEFQELLEATGAQGEAARSIRAGFRRCPTDPAEDGKPFRMGSPDGEKEQGTDEFQHLVTLSPFCMHRFPVTNAQFELFDLAHANERWGWPGNFQPHPAGEEASAHPVVNVTWYQAWCFARWTGNHLPTEAQWEYACRGGDVSYKIFHFGNSLTSQWANFDGTKPYGGAAEHNYLEGTTEVGWYRHSNGFGLHDMHGNIWEWCEDWYAADFYQRENAQQRDPANTKAASARVLRGGGWSSHGGSCRSAARNWRVPGDFNRSFGFRLVAAPCQSFPTLEVGQAGASVAEAT